MKWNSKYTISKFWDYEIKYWDQKSNSMFKLIQKYFFTSSVENLTFKFIKYSMLQETQNKLKIISSKER